MKISFIHIIAIAAIIFMVAVPLSVIDRSLNTGYVNTASIEDATINKDTELIIVTLHANLIDLTETETPEWTQIYIFDRNLETDVFCDVRDGWGTAGQEWHGDYSSYFDYIPYSSCFDMDDVFSFRVGATDGSEWICEEDSIDCTARLQGTLKLSDDPNVVAWMQERSGGHWASRKIDVQIPITWVSETTPLDDSTTDPLSDTPIQTSDLPSAAVPYELIIIAGAAILLFFIIKK